MDKGFDGFPRGTLDKWGSDRGFMGVLWGFCGVLWGFPGFYRVLWGFMGFYRVL